MPILILGGYMDPGFAASAIESAIRSGTSPQARIATVSFGDCTSFAQCRERTLRAAQQWTGEELIVIANSMGGLVARYCAIGAPELSACGMESDETTPAPLAPLHIHTLFTICSPHLGALMAEGGSSSALTLDMRAGSTFLACLDRALATAPYELVCYARTGDAIVGMDRCAPVGKELLWIDTPPFEFAHIGANKDPRILADILARIRDTPAAPAKPAASTASPTPPNR